MSSPDKKTRVAFSVTNCICYDQRVLKMADTVSGLNCNITIIGRKRGECCNSGSVPFNTKRFRMLFERGFFFYMFFNIRLFLYLLFHKFDLLVANDLDTLLPSFLVSKLKKLPLVYDSHEYFTGVPEIQNRPFVKWVWKNIEKNIFPHLQNVITVNNSIAVQYENEYGVRPVVVRNCSPNAGLIVPYTREELGIRPDQLLLIFQGTGINVDRGGEELIEAISQTENVTLLIAGGGDKLSKLINMVKKMELSERVKFYPKMEWKELIRYTKSADAGLSIDRDSNLNYRFILPNKLFEFIISGIAVIASNTVEVKKVVKENNCGLIIPEVNPTFIREAIIELRDNPDLLSEFKNNAVIASEKLNWNNESEIVRDFYRKILTG